MTVAFNKRIVITLIDRNRGKDSFTSTNKSLFNCYQFAEWFSTLWFFSPFLSETNCDNEIQFFFFSFTFDEKEASVNQIKLRSFRYGPISHWLIFTEAKMVFVVLDDFPVPISWLVFVFGLFSSISFTTMRLWEEFHVLLQRKSFFFSCQMPSFDITLF